MALFSSTDSLTSLKCLPLPHLYSSWSVLGLPPITCKYSLYLHGPIPQSLATEETSTRPSFLQICYFFPASLSFSLHPPSFPSLFLLQTSITNLNCIIKLKLLNVTTPNLPVHSPKVLIQLTCNHPRCCLC